MALNIELEAKSIGEIDYIGYGSNVRLSIDIRDADLAGSIEINEIVREFGKGELLDEIGEEEIADWLRERDYTVTEN